MCEYIFKQATFHRHFMTCLISRATTINDDAKIVNTEKYMSAKIHFQGNLV